MAHRNMPWHKTCTSARFSVSVSLPICPPLSLSLRPFLPPSHPLCPSIAMTPPLHFPHFPHSPAPFSPQNSSASVSASTLFASPSASVTTSKLDTQSAAAPQWRTPQPLPPPVRSEHRSTTGCGGCGQHRQVSEGNSTNAPAVSTTCHVRLWGLGTGWTASTRGHANLQHRPASNTPRNLHETSLFLGKLLDRLKTPMPKTPKTGMWLAWVYRLRGTRSAYHNTYIAHSQKQPTTHPKSGR